MLDTLIRPKKKKRNKPRRESRYNVILWNNDYSTAEHVVRILMRVLGVSFTQAFVMMSEAHSTGQAIIFTGSLSQAECVKDKILAHAPDQDSPANCEPTRLIASIQKVQE